MNVFRRMSQDDLDAVLVVQREASVVALGHIFPQAQHPFPDNEVRTRWEREIDSQEIDCFVVVGPHAEVAGFAATRGNKLLHFGTSVDSWGTGSTRDTSRVRGWCGSSCRGS